MNDTTPAPSPRERTPWLTIILAALTFIAFVACSSDQRGIYYPAVRMGGGTVGISSSPGAPPVMYEGTDSAAIAPDYYPYPDGDIPATDTREFLKIGYNAQILTRRVEELTRRVETIVRGYDGRIDQMSSAHRFGYVRFVVPASQFDLFRDEIESLVGSRFIDVEISSQNLLPQKISIEERQKLVEDNLESLKNERATLVATHESTIKSLQAQVDGQTAMLSDLNEQPPSAERDLKVQQLEAVLIDYRSRIENENFSHTRKLASLDARIKDAETIVTAVKNDDQKLLDSVATLEGTISLRFVSLWDIARLYLPGYSIPAILAVLTVISFFYERRLFLSRRLP